MHRLTVNAHGTYLDGLRIDGVTQLVIHIDDGRSYAHITVPVDLDLDTTIDRVHIVRDDVTRASRG